MDDRIQQQKLFGGIPKPAQSSEAVGNDSEGSRKDESNGAGPGNNVQGGGAFGFTLWKQKLGSGQVDAQVPDSVSPFCGAMNHRDYIETWVRQRVVVSCGRGGGGINRDPPHRSIH